MDYNYMVSTTATRKIQPIIDLLNSKFFKVFPLEEFGISIEKLLDLFTNTPDRVNAFIKSLLVADRALIVRNSRQPDGLDVDRARTDWPRMVRKEGKTAAS